MAELRAIGKAQWQLADYVGARRTWLRVQQAIRDDLDLTRHMSDAVRSLEIVLAADRSMRERRAIDL